MKLMLYNTMTRQKEGFEPLQKGKIGIYTCGPTVYNYIHIGNARMAVFFDVVRRFFLSKNYEVTYVQNITDVDDRIIQASKETGEPETAISTFYTDAYNQDLAQLQVLPPDVQPKVTEHIPHIISFIETLIEKGFAYEVNGDVYFRVERFEEYGKLTNQTLSHLQHTEREGVEIIDYKENPHDFALWKGQKEEEIAWDSPWGKGRPGWHIECSVMSTTYLGETFDIHGGGLDLCFPHHENEIAQSEAHSGKPFANYWMHNNFLTVDSGIKMSKSLGNQLSIKDALESHDGETLRYFFLSVNYRNPLDYSEKALHQAQVNVQKIRTTIYNLSFNAEQTPTIQHPVTNDVLEAVEEARQAFSQAMHNDFDTASALDTLLASTKQVNQWMDANVLSQGDRRLLLSLYKEVGDVLGFSFTPNDHTLDGDIEEQIAKRDELKKQAQQTTDKTKRKEWFEEADAIRASLLARGIVLEDTANGTRWKRTDT